MSLVGLFGAFVAVLIVELAVYLGQFRDSDRDPRPVSRGLFLVLILEDGGAGPSAWLHGLADGWFWVVSLVL